MERGARLAPFLISIYSVTLNKLQSLFLFKFPQIIHNLPV